MTDNRIVSILVFVVAIILLVVSCGSASQNRQAALDAATDALLATDAAVTAAMPDVLNGTEAIAWGDRVQQLETAKKAIEMGEGICAAMTNVSNVADLVECAKCSDAVHVSLVALGCDQ